MNYDFVYYKFVVLPDDIKTYHGIKLNPKDPRFDCVSRSGFWEGEKVLTTKLGKGKGQMKFTMTKPQNFIHIDPTKMGNFVFKGSQNLNVTSVHIKPAITGRNGELIGTGEPDDHATLKDGRQNPLFECRKDGFIFLIAPNHSAFEMLVFKDGRNVIHSIVTMITHDPNFWEMLEGKRKKALTFWDYSQF